MVIPQTVRHWLAKLTLGVWKYTTIGNTSLCAILLFAARMADTIMTSQHDDAIKWKHFPRNWPFVRGIHRSPVNSPHKGQWRGALMFSLICARINGWVNNGEAGDLRRYRAHYGVTVVSKRQNDKFSGIGPDVLGDKCCLLLVSIMVIRCNLIVLYCLYLFHNHMYWMPKSSKQTSRPQSNIH